MVTREKRKHLKPDLDFKLQRFRDHTALTIALTREALVDWCIGLTLLEKQLVESLKLRQERGNLIVEIGLLQARPELHRSKMDFRNESINVDLSLNDLGYALHFLLKYFRDGFAEVNHIDVQTVLDDKQSWTDYFTISVPDFAPPVSSREAKKRLGLA